MNPSEPEIILVEEPGRLDVCAAARGSLTRNQAQRLILGGHITVNGKPVKANHLLRPGDTVEIVRPAPEKTQVEAEDIPLDIIYEDDQLVVVNKPQGMVVHPAPGHADGTLVNGLMYRIGDLSGIGGELRPGIVHRIDKMTSGLLVAAKNDSAHQSLSQQFHDHTARRSYLAIAVGNLKEDAGTVDAPIGRHRTDRKKMAVVPDGRPAVTHWRVEERFGSYTLLSLRLETGRTHQIRVHLAYRKHPLAGDTVYGSEKPQLGLSGQALHGYRLDLTHPKTGERLAFFAPIPDYFMNALKKLGETRTKEALLDTLRQEDRQDKGEESK